jgi:hypothetical protein
MVGLFAAIFLHFAAKRISASIPFAIFFTDSSFLAQNINFRLLVYIKHKASYTGASLQTRAIISIIMLIEFHQGYQFYIYYSFTKLIIIKFIFMLRFE